MRILLLGGTTEASQMAMALANAGVDAVFSYAGRTKMPVGQPLETRIGGFGGLAGLCSTFECENSEIWRSLHREFRELPTRRNVFRKYGLHLECRSRSRIRGQLAR